MQLTLRNGPFGNLIRGAVAFHPSQQYFRVRRSVGDTLLIRLLMLFLGLLWFVSSSVEAGVRVTNVATREVDYVVDADEARDGIYQYHLIKGTVSVEYSGEFSAKKTRIVVSLVYPNEEGQDVAVPLVSGTNGTTAFNPGDLTGSQTVTHDFDFALDPDELLDSDRAYRVIAQLQWFESLGGNLGIWRSYVNVAGAGEPRKYFHFTNTGAQDAQFNVKGRVESVTLDRIWRMESLSDANRNYVMSCDIQLARYDDLDVAPLAENIPFQIRLALLDDNGNTVGLSRPLIGIENYNLSIDSHTRAGLPEVVTQSVTISWRPDEQLDSVNRQYHLQLKLFVKTALLGAYAQRSELESDSTHFRDYNGNLVFGSGSASVTAVMKEASTSGGIVHVFPTYIFDSLTIGELSLSADDVGFTGGVGSIPVHLLPNGDASYAGAGSIILSNESGNVGHKTDFRGVLYEVGPQITLSSSGVTGTVNQVWFPAGVGRTGGVTPPAWNIPLVSYLGIATEVPLSRGLLPLSNVSWNFPSGVWIVEESKPIGIEVTAIEWNISGGRFELSPTGDVFHPETAWRAALNAAPSGIPNREKHSNQDYWLLASGVDTSEPVLIKQASTDPVAGSSGVLSAEFLLGDGVFRTHFPEAVVDVDGNANTIKVEEDMIVPEESALNDSIVSLLYLAGDPDASPSACTGAALTERAVMMIPDNPQEAVSFTPTGGLSASCRSYVSGGHELKWGFLGGDQYAFATDAFQQLDFYASGTFYKQPALSIGGSELGLQYTPVAMHVSGYVDGYWKFSDLEFVNEPYRTNSLRADYAGINLRVANEAAGFQGYSVISGEDAGAYPLKDHCRYYARKSGVTGIHDALGGPSATFLYGFPAMFSAYGLSFRDCRTVDSETNGSLVVPYPSDFELPLDQIRFTSTGRPINGRLPQTASPVTMAYWNCQMTPVAVAFSSTDPCDATNGLVRVQAEVNMPNIGHTLQGELGFRSDGRIVHSEDGVDGITSRLKAPTHVSIRGPAKVTPEGQPTQYENYSLIPVTDVYLNNYDDYASDDPQGFINLAGTLDVAFFKDLEVVVQTTAGTAGQGGIAPIHMMSGWGNAFSDPENFDPTNRGFPSGSSPEDFRTNAAYRPHAYQSWLGLIDFDYPLLWDDSTRSFRSPDDWDGEVDLLVMDANHRLAHLSAETADLRFGLAYDGIPSIDLGGMLINALDDATGVMSAVEDALGNAAALALYAGSDAVAGLLNDGVDELIGPVLEEALNTDLPAPLNGSIVDFHFLESLRNANGGLIPQSGWEDTLTTSFEDGTYGIKRVVQDLAAFSHSQLQRTFLSQISSDIDEMIDMIDVFSPPEDDSQYPGLLSMEDGEYRLAGTLVYKLIDHLASEDLKTMLGIEPGAPAFDWIDLQTKAYLADYENSLTSIRSRLEQIRTQLEDIQSRLQSNGTLEAYIQGMFVSNDGIDELEALVPILVNDMMGHLESTYGGNLQAFALDSNREATGRFLVRRIRDRLAAGAVAAGVQKVMREQLQDLQAAIDQSIGSTFSTVNLVIRDLVNEAAGELDEQINPLNGALASVAGVGSLDGCAVIRGDRLDHLRLDASLQLELHEPMKFQGFLEINQLLADSGYGNAVEIEVGAVEVPIELFGSSADFTIIGRVILDENNAPVSLGGSIEMVNGRLNYDCFEIYNLGAALQFGISDNYFACELGLQFNEYRVEGAIFAGHSNSIEPLLMVDEDVGEMVEAPITGVYAYGEGHMPIIDWSCFFNVSAGAGIGAFYFHGDPPQYGAKIKLEAEGEALCVVSVGGEVVLVGVKSDKLRFKGRGKIKGKAGWCPVCVKFNKNVTFTYEQGKGFDASW